MLTACRLEAESRAIVGKTALQARQPSFVGRKRLSVSQSVPTALACHAAASVLILAAGIGRTFDDPARFYRWHHRVRRAGDRTDGQLLQVKIASKNVPGPVDAAVYLPPGYEAKRAEVYPLVIQLHGGGGSSANMTLMSEVLETAIEQKLISPVVSVMPSASRSFYMDYRDGSQKWETFVLTDLIAHMRGGYNVAKRREGTFITGISMGGMGSIRMAFKHPELFAGVASMEPGIEPALEFKNIKLRDRFGGNRSCSKRSTASQSTRPTGPTTTRPRLLRAILPDQRSWHHLEAGDQDTFFLHHGTEFLHRILFDGGVSHEYRLVKGAEHVGPSIPPRFLDAMAFFGRIINPPTNWTLAPAVTTARQRIDNMKRATGYPINPHDPQTLRTQ